MTTLTASLLILMSMTFVASATGTDPKPRKPVEFTAHRGESYDHPENTLAAFKSVWERDDATSGELDVHLTSDGKLIVSHDADTHRTAGGPKLVIKDHTADELRKLDVGSWKDPKFASERLPLLDEVLPTIPAGRRMFVEVKVGPEAIPELVKCVERSGKKPEQIVVISFNLATCREAKKALPKHKVYFLSSFKQDKQTKQWSPTAAGLIAKAKEAGLDGLDLNAANAEPINADFVKAVHAAGLEMHVWTIDDPARARQLIAAGVDSITTNRAAWLKKEMLNAER